MKKIILLTLFFSLTLLARENPFAPFEQTIQTIPILPKPIQIKKVIQKAPEKIIKTTIPIAKTFPIDKVLKAPTEKPKKKYKKKSTFKSKLLFNGEFIKIKLFKNSIKITTKDNLLKHFKQSNPNRISFNFERFDIQKPFFKKIYSKKVKQLNLSHHDYFYKATFKLGKNRKYRVIKKHYGYLILL